MGDLAIRVVIPVRDDLAGVEQCLKGLRCEDASFRVTVVDDGSSVALDALVADYGAELLRQENRGSYSARNRGVEASDEQLLAFCDADCVPLPGWLSAGARALSDPAVALVAGHVEFTFSARPSGAERFDAMSNMQIEQGVRARSVGKTANLFVRRSVFDDIGYFPEECRSGGDVAWTKRATLRGHRMVFCADAVVQHPARRILALIAKQIRVGRGQQAMPPETRPGSLLSGLKPAGWSRVRYEHHSRGWPTSGSAVTRTWVAGIAASTATLVGRLLAGPGHRT